MAGRRCEGPGLIRVIMEFLRDLWLFLKQRKKWWLVPLIILIVLIAVLVVLGGTSALAPFIYTLF
ncbi:MAG TPA: DUF5989 family protein [Puia sp.]|nr:DUF5989 family protein [Puia sp.]